MFLGHCCNVRELQLLTKQPHCVLHREEDAEAILDPPLHTPWMNVILSRVQAEAWDPLEMAVSIAWIDHGGMVWAGMPCFT